MEESRQTRGLRNNNPLNIRLNPRNNWLGKVAANTDGEFEQFDTMEYGIRAAYRLLCTYYDRYGLHDIVSIVSRFAPPSENDTEGYIRDVMRLTGKAGRETLRRSELPEVLFAMAQTESGQGVRKYKYMFNQLNPYHHGISSLH